MKRIIFFGACMVLSIITFGQIQTQNMLQEIKCTPPQFTGIEKAIPSQAENRFPTIEQYLKKNINYPDDDVIYGIQGTEVAKFVITQTGDITDITIINSVSKNMDKELIRVLKNTNGMWKPGYNDDKPEIMEKEVSLVFKIQGLEKYDFNYRAKTCFAKGNIQLLNKGNPKKALKYFDKVIVLLPNDKALLVQRGLARYEAGNKDGAFRDWNRVRMLGGVESKSYLENFSNLKGYAGLVRTLEN